VNPRYPIYIVSKGRWESRQTARALERINVPYRIVIEPQEYYAYAAVIDPAKILVLPFSNLGQGSIPARNWVWEHSIREGRARHWILDDNIHRFSRYHMSRKTPVADGAIFRAAEDFTDRFSNVPMAGFQYEMFVIAKRGHCWKPFDLNTRIYSCILLSNEVPHRWRGRYNEDTDLSIRFLKDGYCTILFYAFLAAKTATMSMKGGNTDELYRRDEKFDGRLEMAKSLQRQHPDVVRLYRKWNRWQHLVDYRPFKNNRLILRPGVSVPTGTDEYGMELVPAA
jgi:hypothetical protein